jgi:uncharacterized protein (DUF302 family)
MLKADSEQKLTAIEPALRQAAQRHGANVISAIHLGHLLRDKHLANAQDAFVFTIYQPDLSAALLEADMRFAAFVPCRIAAYEHGERVTLEAFPPSEGCRLLNRPDLERLALLLDKALGEIMEEAARPVVAAAHPAATGVRSGVGATEEQVNVRGMVPQRIDRRGTKVEDVAGTGEHDSPGG